MVVRCLGVDSNAATLGTRSYEADDAARRARPSTALMSAALSGLLGLGGAACGGDHHHDPDPDQRPDASVMLPVDAAPADAAEPDANDSKIISETPGNKTFAELTAECDTRGGYVQIHASCAGTNSCAGFSYGDWSPGVLSEHTCAGVNGCNGLSCVVLPADQGRTAQEILAEQLPETGPRPCSNCHAEWNDDGPDFTKFKVYLLPGSGRTAQNWLDLPAEAQARTIAFGKRGLLDDGTAYSNMVGYHQLLSRAEIERVVDYLRTSTEVEIVFKDIKIADPVP